MVWYNLVIYSLGRPSLPHGSKVIRRILSGKQSTADSKALRHIRNRINCQSPQYALEHQTMAIWIFTMKTKEGGVADWNLVPLMTTAPRIHAPVSNHLILTLSLAMRWVLAKHDEFLCTEICPHRIQLLGTQPPCCKESQGAVRRGPHGGDSRMLPYSASWAPS